MAHPTPFKLHVPDLKLEELSQRLAWARVPEQPVGYTVKQGVESSEMRRLLASWKDDFLPKWREHEAELNRLPMFTAPVISDEFGELNIHFVHQKSLVKTAIPLLFVHGWPGSFIEVKKLLPLLVSDGQGSPSFHVVAPSLPNFGFSDGVPKKGFNLRHYGEVCHKLMLALGYDQYVTQGGDWGSIITRIMARNYSSSIRAVHVNLTFVNPANFLWQPLRLLQGLLFPWTKLEKRAIWNSWRYITVGNQYYKMHQHRPQTVAYCLEDSPVALLGWIYEKLLHWTDKYEWTDDEILTWISIYWFSKAGPGASVRIYHEAEELDPDHSRKGDKDFFGWIPVPLGLSQFPEDICGVPKAFARTLGPLVFESWSEHGGHFAAWEKPEVLANDLRKMFGREGGAFGVVDSLNGYSGPAEEKKNL